MAKENDHKCPDTTDAAITVIRFLGANITLIVMGVVTMAIVKNQPLPEWIKDIVLLMIGALTGLLAKTGRSEIPSPPTIEHPLPVNMVNPVSDPGNMTVVTPEESENAKKKEVLEDEPIKENTEKKEDA